MDDDGFLYNPEHELARYYNPEAKTLEDYGQDNHCLVLLGEPGIGKSTSLEEEGQRLHGILPEPEKQSMYVNLADYGDESRLIRDLFESDNFKSFEQSDYSLYMLLDSLDECALLMEQVPIIIGKELEKRKDILPRLHIRISCRTNAWSFVLRNRLPIFFESLGYQELNLCPLRWLDVEIASEAEGISTSDFKDAIAVADVTPLASTPLDLNLLISEYIENGTLPDSKFELFENVCRKRATEWSDVRKDLRKSGGTGNLTANQRLAIAARIAEVSIFCDKPYFAVEEPPNTDDSVFLTLSELCGYTEKVDGIDVEVTEEAVFEVLGTAFFSGRGPNLFGFTHKAFTEFLASYYFKIKEIQTDRILQLMRSANDSHGRIPLQFHGIASWIGSWNAEVLTELATNHPKLLLKGDLSQFGETAKRQIVNTFLSQISTGNEKYDWEYWKHYRKLNYPTIGEHLRTWIECKENSRFVRAEAIRIAERCQATELQDLFVDIILDDVELLEIRGDAARALSIVGDLDHKREILPLLNNISNEDTEDDLRGNLLRVLWPDVITTESLFENLPVPKRSSLMGSYASFLTYKLPDDLKAEHLPSALEWVRRLVGSENHDIRRLSDKILLAALKEADLVGHTALTCLALIEQHHLIQDRDTRTEASNVLEDPELRHSLLLAIIQNSSAPDRMLAYEIRNSNPAFVTIGDFGWILERFMSDYDPQFREVWEFLILQTLDRTNVNQVDQLIEASEESTLIAQTFSGYLKSVQLDSEEARELRRNHERWVSPHIKTMPMHQGPSQSERIESTLQQIKAGNHDAWAALPYQMANETMEEGEFPSNDITNDPGWGKSDERTRSRIVNSAIDYLKKATPNAEEWIGRSEIRLGDIAPFQAFYLLWRYYPDRLALLDQSIWRRWAAYFLGPILINDINDPAYDLVHEAYIHAPDEIVETLLRIIWIEAVSGKSIRILDKVKTCVDRRMGDALFALLHDMEIVPENWGALLTFLVRNNYEPAVERATEILSGQSNEQYRELMIIAASTLLKYRPEESWTSIWEVISKDIQLGKDILKRYAHRFDVYSEGYHSLTVDAFRDLFIWLAQQFPFGEDPVHDGAYSPSDDDHVREFRNGILAMLKAMGTLESVEAIDYIKNSLPEHKEWLNRVAIDARDTRIQKSWIPLEPQDFLKFVCEPDSVLITDPSELQEQVLEGLKKYEASLHGETAVIENLWNEISKGVFRPKDENHFSDNVKIYLDHYLKGRNIVCAREAEARRGDETDIIVMAKIPGRDPIKVIVESKGCWHQDVEKNMEDQLVGRYLHENQCRHGIYLVGWFICPKWNKAVYREQKTVIPDIEEAREIYDEKARKLSHDDLSVKVFVMDTGLR